MPGRNLGREAVFGQETAENKEWWLRDEDLSLTLINRPTIPDGPYNRELFESLMPLQETIFGGIEAAFAARGIRTRHWLGETIAEDEQPHNVALNPVYLGRLPEPVRQVMNGASGMDEFKAALKEHVPESYPSLALDIGTQMGVKPALNQPNFTNVIFLEEPSNEYNISQIPDDKLVLLMRTLMAKQGSFRNLAVPYRMSADGPLADEIILGTLEGGHPVLNSLDGLAYRMMALGSAENVKIEPETLSDTAIPADVWQASAVVNGMRSLGNFLGDKKLISDPVIIEELVKNERLAKMIALAVGWTRQAEGAFYAHDPEIAVGMDLPWSGLPIVTSSGRFGTFKTNLDYIDMTGIVPTGDRNIGMIPVIGQETRMPSVEAEEFLKPMLEMVHRYLRLRRVEGGYVYDSKGDIVVPPIRAVVHKHRGVARVQGTVTELPRTDLRVFPAVGCGVNLMEKMSSYAMDQAAGVWESDNTKTAATFYVPNHGTNSFIFWTPDEQGIIPLDPFEQFKRSIETGELVFTPEVPQV